MGYRPVRRRLEHPAEIDGMREACELLKAVYEEVSRSGEEPWADVIAESVADSCGLPWKRTGPTGVEIRNRKRLWDSVLHVHRGDDVSGPLIPHHVVWR